MRITRRSQAAALALAALALATVGVAAATSPPRPSVRTLSAVLGSATRVAVQSGGTGYWLATADGGVYTFGTAHFYGSLAGRHLNSPIVGIVATPDSRGYWLVAKDGGVFTFGDAVFSGSLGSKNLNAPVIGIASGAGAATGAHGPTGATGARGATGPAGARGLTGAAGPVTHFAYVYNLAAQAVAVEANVVFDGNGPLSGFTHTLGASAITATFAGTYIVNFSASATPVSEFALTLNGVPVPQATYGSGAGTQQNNGQVILALGAGDVLTLLNHTSPAAVALPTTMGGSQANVNASILIEQVG